MAVFRRFSSFAKTRYRTINNRTNAKQRRIVRSTSPTISIGQTENRFCVSKIVFAPGQRRSSAQVLRRRVQLYFPARGVARERTEMEATRVFKARVPGRRDRTRQRASGAIGILARERQGPMSDQERVVLAVFRFVSSKIINAHHRQPSTS